MPTKEEIMRMGNEAPIVGQVGPETTEDLNKLAFVKDYILHYKAIHNVGQVYFKGPEDFPEAIRLGNKYCAERNWRFIQVRPMFVDILQKRLTEEERAEKK